MSLLAGGRQAPPQAERAAPVRPLTGRLAEAPDSAGVVARRAGMRLVALDVWRGLAVVFMVVDHLAYRTGVADVFRLLPGRLAMPLFFLIAGALVVRLTGRHLQAAALGLLLPLVVPWIDSPNVLVWWALGCAFIVGARWAGVPLWVPVVLAVAAYTNGYGHGWEHSYGPVGLLALMCLGAMLPLSTWASGARVRPRPLRDVLAWVGRHALSLYVAHLLALQLVLVAIEGWFP